MENSANTQKTPKPGEKPLSKAAEQVSFDEKHKRALGFRRYFEIGLWRQAVSWTGTFLGAAIGGVLGKKVHLAEKVEKYAISVATSKAALKVGLSEEMAQKLAGGALQANEAVKKAKVVLGNTKDTIGDALKSSEEAEEAVRIAESGVKDIFQRIKNFGTEEPNRVSKKLDPVGIFAGMMVGSMIAGFFLGYRKWRREEAERIAVAEINEDVSNMKIRTRTDESLLQENTALRGMWEDEIGRTDELKAITAALEKKKSPIDHATRAAPKTLQAI